MIDLRSDTVTRPSDGMREAIAKAEVGDDVYGDDPTVNSLEMRVAEMFGKEAGLFTPTGSLANQLGIRLLVGPGEELITETHSHIVRAELGAAAVFSGITTRTWLAEQGKLIAEQALEIARPDSGPYLVSTTAIAVENTHNFGGGIVQPIAEIKKLHEGAEKLGIKLHLDGARIWNAHVESGVALSEYGKYFETVSVCLSKGLGAPVGSVLLSTRKNIEKARIWRKRYGAGMRQIGLLAAAGHYALDHNINRLADDHAKAQILAKAINSVVPKAINPVNVHTNILAINLNELPFTSSEIAERCKKEGVLISALGSKFARVITHMDISEPDVITAAEVLKRAFVA
jgi:threonine aldolase